jgi:hypothetical protein
MKTAVLNYWVDVVTGIAFAASAVSGVVFLLPGQTGSAILGVSLRWWSDAHTWSSLLAVGGVLTHVMLHWRWVAAVTRRQFAPAQRPATVPVRVPVGSARPWVTRRSFLGLAGTVGLAGAIGAIGVLAPWRARDAADGSENLNAVNGNTTGASGGSGEPGDWIQGGDRSRAESGTAGISEGDVQTQPTIEVDEVAAPGAGTGVACRHGVVNDRDPGQCRHYVDRDGDGICDLSIPGSGTNRSIG